MSTGAMMMADDDTLSRIIESAEERLIVVTPGLSLSVAKGLADKWRRMGADKVVVTLDVDAEVCRLGMGNFKAVELLEETAHNLGATLNIQPGLRIAVIIADHQTLIYAPTIEYVHARPESGANRTLQPNALYVGLPPADLERDLGMGPDGIKEQTIGLDKAERSTIKEVKQDLEKCPPQPFNLTRRLRVFTAHIQFVELRLTGCMVGRRSIRIPSDLIGLTDETTRKLLESKFRILAEGDTGVWGEELRRIKEFIVERFMVLLPGFGHVVRISDQPRLELAVNTLRKLLNRSRERKHKKVQAAIDRHLAALVNALLPAVMDHPPAHWRRMPNLNPAARLKHELTALVGGAEELLAEAKVEMRYKGVTYETLRNPEFIATVKKAMPDLRALHDEVDAAPVC